MFDNLAFAVKRLEAFHKKISTFCATRGGWRANMERAKIHMERRAAEKHDYLRIGITDEMVAAILIQGLLILDKSFTGSPIEIVVDGVLSAVKYVDRDNLTEVVEKDICVRVMVRERPKKHLVVTAYPLRGADANAQAPRVSHEEIW